jgi:hypothetical protein
MSMHPYNKAGLRCSSVVLGGHHELIDRYEISIIQVKRKKKGNLRLYKYNIKRNSQYIY